MTAETTEPAPAPPAGAGERPERLCDLVMKGGVTSGIVYPKAVSVLKEVYTFKNIGGTSAGAMAAAATAAAEHGRKNGHPGGFEELDGLADWLAGREGGGEHTRLFSLFQPTARTRPLYNVLVAAIGPSREKAASVVRAAVRSFWGAAIGGAVPGLALAGLALAATTCWTQVVLLGFAAALTLLGIAMAVGLAIVACAGRELPAAGFGLCPGCADPKPGHPPALTNWLTAYLNRLAGKPEDGPPLTFGDLWGTQDPKEERKIQLAMVTTNLTHGRPHRLPDLSGGFFFDPDELKGYFPEHVVTWMVEHPRASKKDHDRFKPLRPMPDPADLPVVVAARMSLALPVLIGAVPLYTIDYGPFPYISAAEKERVRPERCWFSDGGICSNFPVHFFDGYLPRWPTFGINLKPFDPDDRTRRNAVWMPETNDSGTTVLWNRFDRAGGLASVGGFLKAIVDAARNWSDSTLLPLPGYRDRIVHVSLDEATEGGMNLDMPEETIRALAERGEEAGRRLIRHFADPSYDGELTWDNHRWVRFRSLMALIEDMLDDINVALKRPAPGDKGYDELVGRGPDDPPGSYRLHDPGQRKFAVDRLEQLAEMIDDWLGTHSSNYQFRKGNVPRPRPSLRIGPDL